MAKLNLFNKKDSLTNLSFLADIDIKGNDIDKFTGTANIDSLYYFDSKQNHSVPIIQLRAENNNGKRLIDLKSNAVDGSLVGNYKLKQFKDIYQMFLSAQIPDYEKKYKKITPQTFDLDVTFKDTEPFTSVLIPELGIDSGTSITSKFNTDKKFAFINVHGRKLKYEDLRLDRYELVVSSTRDSLEVEFNAKNSNLFGVKNIDDLGLSSSLLKGIGENHFKVELNWKEHR